MENFLEPSLNSRAIFCWKIVFKKKKNFLSAYVNLEVTFIF